MTERNYAADMRAAIDEQTQGEYTAPQAATDLVDKLRAGDPDLLSGWLDAQAVILLTDVIRRINHGKRRVAKSQQSRSVFANAATAHESGDSTSLTTLLDTPWTLPGGTIRPLRAMTKDDLIAVSSDYDTRARENMMNAAFMRALAKKVQPGQTVQDVFSEEQVAAMWGSLNH
jgi:hypothetical protein